MVNCGKYPEHVLEKFVELPDNYVMTGFSGYVQKNNFVGISAYARIYDPLSFSLIGEVKRFYVGSTAEEIVFNADSKSSTLVTGIGLRSYDSNLRGYKAFTAFTKYP